MSNMVNSGFVELHSQHTLQHADWMTISGLAKAENLGECFLSWDFEDFLGLAVYLFVTTQSKDTREQLSQLLPKFGSAAVLPLLKILCKKEIFVEKTIPTLAQQSLTKMAPYPLVIGLNQVLNLKAQGDLKAAALQILRRLLQSCEPSTIVVLSQLLSDTNRQLVAEVSASKLSVYSPHVTSRKPHERGSGVAAPERRALQCV